MSETQVVSADRVYTGDEVLAPGTVEISGERIVAVHEGRPAERPSNYLDLGPVTLAPGFVDQHSHGGGGAAFTEGAEAARLVAATHLQHGTTTMMASLVTDSPEMLSAQIAELEPLVASGELLGIHLEGPWLSEKYHGAHQTNLLRLPSLSDMQSLVSSPAVKMVTIAPELEGALDAIRWMGDHGVIAAIGHTSANMDQTREGFEAGSSLITHLFNAMTPIHHRNPGPVVAALNDPNVVVEMITDGIHLNAEIIKMVFGIKNGNVVLVTDAMAAAGQPDGSYMLGPMSVTVRDGVARLDEGGAIAGSTLTLDRAVKFCVQHGIDLYDALFAASTRPAMVLGLDNEIGRIRPNCFANLVGIDDTLSLRYVVLRGKSIKLGSGD